MTVLITLSLGCDDESVEGQSGEDQRVEESQGESQDYEQLELTLTDVDQFEEPRLGPTHDTCPPCYIDTGTGHVHLEWAQLSEAEHISMYLKMGDEGFLHYTGDAPGTDSVDYKIATNKLERVVKAWAAASRGRMQRMIMVPLRR